jgi:hypothetical protein
VEADMRMFMISLASLGVILSQELGAQNANDIAPGEQVRITAPECNLPRKGGRFGGLVGDSIHLRMGGRDLTCAMPAVHRLEVYQGRRRWNRGATVGALGGGAAAALILLALDNEAWSEAMILGVPAGAAVTTGERARKWFLIGTGIGAGSGALVGAAACAGDREWGPGFCAVILGAYGAAGGATAGSIIGLILGEDRWEEVALPRVQPLVKVYPDGRMGLGISIPLRR